MKTIIRASSISEAGFSPRLYVTIYDHDSNQFFKKNFKISREFEQDLHHQGGLTMEMVDEIEGEVSQMSDDEIIEMYQTYIEYPLNQGLQITKEYIFVENYIKSLKRNQKIDDIGIK